MDPPDRKQKRDSPNYSRPRGILKKDRTQRLTWDEGNLSMNEAQKTPKMKISEPKTPYHHDSGYIVDDESMEEPGRRSPPEMHQNLMSRWDEVVSKMEQVQAHQMRSPSSPKISPQTSAGSLVKDPVVGVSNASPTAPAPVKEWGDQKSPKRDEELRDRRNSRTSESGSESDSASERKKKVFAERRKAHYNEFQVLKKIGRDLQLEEEEETELAIALAESAAAQNKVEMHLHHRTPAAATPTSVPCSSPGRNPDEHMADP